MARVLLIDDDNAVRDMLRLTLDQLGHTVVEAGNGREGLELFQQSSFDLLITDIVMPEKEGLEVLMEVRRKQPPVKIIAISGGGRQSTVDYLQMAKFMGAGRVLAKPFSNEELVAAVDDLLYDREPLSQPPASA
jgi:DNA-binding response OmpR family regulator